MKFLVVFVAILALVAAENDPAFGETILQPSGIQTVGGGVIMTPSANQYSSCSTCQLTNSCPLTCGVSVAYPTVTVQPSCSSYPSDCTTCAPEITRLVVTAQPTFTTTSQVFVPVYTPPKPMIPATVIQPVSTCGCLSSPVCACRTTILLEKEEKVEEKKDDQVCGCLSQPTCPCRTVVTADVVQTVPVQVVTTTPVIAAPITTTVLSVTPVSSCGCAVCPCPTNVCGCVGQPTCNCWVRPEIVDYVPLVTNCFCTGSLNCPC